MSDCSSRKETYFGWKAWCRLPAGHQGEHQSADFAWLNDDKLAHPKPHAQPEVKK